MKLYYSPGACSLAPHIVAREAGLSVELTKVDLATHRVAGGGDYLAINPRGYVPLLVLDDGEHVSEASVIVQYLAEQGGNPDLLPPAGTRERLRVQQWLNFVATELHKTFSPWLWHKETAGSTQEAARAKLAERFAELDRRLADRPFLTGERFTVADAYAFTIVNWSNFLGLDLGPYPHLAAFLRRVAERPQVREALRAEGLLKRHAA
ncbi:MAG TPA: glutathione transferase GstA [Acetobacteraceae bacterium]|nr:glutathione transferase GstA [Acetobacteraceae bacterium]